MRTFAKFRLSALALSLLAAPLFAHETSSVREIEGPSIAGGAQPLPSFPMPADFNTSLDYRSKQLYLDSFFATNASLGTAIGGANVLAARNYPGGDGSHARIVNFSHGRWMFNHPNLPVPFADVPDHDHTYTQCTDPYHFAGETAMMGVLAARDTGYGITGVAPESKVASVEFVWSGPFSRNHGRLLELVQPGDVVVFPHQYRSLTAIGGFKFFPEGTCHRSGMCTPMTEWHPDTNELIRKLVNEKQAHVVMDAGRGGVNLDHPGWGGHFDRENDSGAIYVGAVDAKTAKRYEQNPDGTSPNNANYGSRVDLAGWYGLPAHYGLDPDWHWTTQESGNGYARYFGDIALPQVAGVVALVQSVAFADEKIGRALPPKYLRQLLVETGHELPLNDPTKPIGKYPDAEAAVIKLLEHRDDGTLAKAFELGDWPGPITATLNVPSEVKVGESFTVSIDAHGMLNRPLTYAWKWMGSNVEPVGHKFTPISKDGESSMDVRAGTFEEDVDAYIRVIVSDGENERDFLQKVVIRSANYSAYQFGTNYNSGDRVAHEGRVFECKPTGIDGLEFNSWCGSENNAFYEPGKGVFWSQAWREIDA